MRRFCRWVSFASFAAALAAPSGPQGASAQSDPYLALQTHIAGQQNYVRRSEVQAFLDVSPAHCIIFLSNGEEMRAFQKCATMTDHLKKDGLVTFPTSFGSVLLSPYYILTMHAMSNGSCRLNLRNGKFVIVNPSCKEVHDATPLE